MYEEHFKLKRKPFEQLPDPAFLYLTDQHDEALTRMQFALAINDSFVIITGEVGSGKTTLVRKMLSEMDEASTLAFITHTRISDVELLQSILVEFGIRPFEMGKIEMLAELRKFISQQHDSGKRVIIIVDEAQNLGMDILEELRLLTCLDSVEEKAMNIILIGQPQLSKLIDSPDLEQLRQRCRLRFHLHRLSRQQTIEYVQHRIGIARGKDVKLFDDVAESMVYENARGVPRLINTLCDTALMMASLASKDIVGKDEISESLAELGWSAADTGSFQELPTQSPGTHWRTVVSLQKDGQQIADYELRESSYVIGRADDCSINVDSKYLSRHHAIISRIDGDWTISDLRSTNGIRVNGKRVQVQKLSHGDIVAIGIHHLIFRMFQEEVASAEAATGTFSDSAMAETFVIVDDFVVENGDDK